MKFSLSTSVVVLAALITSVVGESVSETHTVHFDNRCGFGTPMLIQGPNVLSTGDPYTSDGPLISAIAYLQTGSCGFNGEGCTLVETTLVNPTSDAGSGSSTDISLIPPHAFTVTAGFGYYGGCDGVCDGTGTDCESADCPTAFHVDHDTHVQVACQADNVNLAITFCK